MRHRSNVSLGHAVVWLLIAFVVFVWLVGCGGRAGTTTSPVPEPSKDPACAPTPFDDSPCVGKPFVPGSGTSDAPPKFVPNDVADNYPMGVVAWVGTGGRGGWICLPINAGNCEDTPDIQHNIPPLPGQVACVGDQSLNEHTMPVRCTEAMVSMKPRAEATIRALKQATKAVQKAGQCVPAGPDCWEASSGWYVDETPGDVPPITTREIDGYDIHDNPLYGITRKCADDRRFLLRSEDGVWHCLRLVPVIQSPAKEPPR